MSGVKLQEGEQAIPTEPADNGAVRALVEKSRGNKGIDHIGTTTPEQVLHWISSQRKGGLPLKVRRTVKKR